MSLNKTYEQFLNENLDGEYLYYGTGSLFPIASKLKQEGKSAEQIWVYLTTLGVDNERKQKVLHTLFKTNESFDFSYLDEASDVDTFLKADVKDLSKGVSPEKATVDTDVKTAIDKLKSDEDKKEDEDKPKEDESSNPKIEALKSALQDAEKLEKIKEILAETLENKK